MNQKFRLPLAITVLVIVSLAVTALTRDVRQWRMLNSTLSTHLDNQHYDAAIAVGQSAVALARQSWGEDSDRFELSLRNLATSHLANDDFAAAEPLYQRALAITIARGHAREIVTAANDLADIYRGQERYREAEAMYLKARAHLSGVQQQSQELELANGFGLAEAYRAQGAAAKAEAEYRRVEATITDNRLFNPDLYASALHAQGYLAFEREDYAQAQTLYAEALRLRKQVLAPSAELIGRSAYQLGRAYGATEDYANAERAFKEAIKYWDSIDTADPGLRLASLQSLATICRISHRDDEAKVLDDAVTAQAKRIAGAKAQ